MTGRSPKPTPTSASWQLALDVENGSIDCGVQLEHIHGGVTLNGHYAPQRFVSHGAVEIDSMIYKGIQLTNIRGPLSIDRTRVAFGQWASSTPPDQPFPRPLYADTLGGTLSGSAQIWLADSRYELEGTLQDANLATVSREATARQHNISGRAYATVRLRGETRGIHTLRGDGQVQLRRADIYELPIMLRLLKLLSIKPADDTAFTSSNVLFRIKGDQIYLDHIVFAGDAISLEGRGEMNLERAINLTFDTSVGRDDGQPLSLLLRPFLKEAGRRLMVLRVTGTLDDPQVARIPLPDVSETIQQVFPSGPDAPRPAIPRLSRPTRRLD